MNGPQAPFFVDREVIILTRNGVWLADGAEITHEPTQRLFARSLRRHVERPGQKAGWYLEIGRETKHIEVEDTAYFVMRVEGTPAQGFSLLLNDETREPLDAMTLAYRPGRLACRLKRGEDARFLHASYFDLLQHLEEDAETYFLTIAGHRCELARKD